MYKSDARSIADQYSRLKRNGTFEGTIKAAMAKRKARQLNPPLRPAKAISVTSAAFKGWARVNIGPDHEARVVARAKAETRKRVFSIIPATFLGAQNNHSVETHFEKHRGRYYPRHTNTVHSLSRAHAWRRSLIANIDGVPVKITARKGFVFGRDANGVYIAYEKTANDPERQYHPNSDEILGGNAAMIAALKDHIRKRAEIKRRAAEELTRRAQMRRALKAAESVGIYVCARDSYDAGNCQSGTLAWGRREGLSPDRHYPIRVIKRLMDTDPLVARVIRQARDRAMREMDQGVCWLADHKA